MHPSLTAESFVAVAPRLLNERQQLAQSTGSRTEAFRLTDAEGDDLPGLWVDVYARHWLVQARDRGLPRSWETLPATGLCDSLWLKQLNRESKEAPVCMAGAAPATFNVSENDMRFEIQPASGYSCGLFIDQRENRRLIRHRVQPGQRILNLFAYTASFSVAAALAGGVTTTVDLNGSYLDWGRRNFALNALDPSAHFWIKGDSFDWLAAFAKKGRLFDGVILDPPTFSRGTRKKVFRLERDFAELVALAAAVVEPGGWLLACANTHRLDPVEFEHLTRQGLRQAGKQAPTPWQCLPMPPDFTGPPYLKSMWLDCVS